MTKIQTKVKIDYQFDWTYGVEIEQMRKDLDELEKLGATYIEIEAHESYGSASIEMSAHMMRLETDEEYKNRIDRHIRQQELIKSAELKKLHELKLKYEQ